MARFSKAYVRIAPEKTTCRNTPSMAETPRGRQVVEVNSTVRLKNLDSGVEATFVLTRPGSVRVPQNGLSVSFPLGRAVLGKRVGDSFVYDAAGGPVRIEVTALSGDPERNFPAHT